MHRHVRSAAGRLRRRWFVCLAALVLWVAGAQASFGSFVSSPSSTPSQSLTALTLAAPAGLAASCALVSLAPKVTLTWGSSPKAAVYLVLRSGSSGTETQIATSTVTTYVDTSAPVGTDFYEVRATVGAHWISGVSNEVSVVTALACV